MSAKSGRATDFRGPALSIETAENAAEPVKTPANRMPSRCPMRRMGGYYTKSALIESRVSWYNTGMKIKKPISEMAPVAAATGGATIADRFKLDLTNPADVKAASVSKSATTAAFIAGLVALAVTGLLTFILFQHWSFL